MAFRRRFVFTRLHTIRPTMRWDERMRFDVAFNTNSYTFNTIFCAIYFAGIRN